MRADLCKRIRLGARRALALSATPSPAPGSVARLLVLLALVYALGLAVAMPVSYSSVEALWSQTDPIRFLVRWLLVDLDLEFGASVLLGLRQASGMYGCYWLLCMLVAFCFAVVFQQRWARFLLLFLVGFTHGYRAFASWPPAGYVNDVILIGGALPPVRVPAATPAWRLVYYCLCAWYGPAPYSLVPVVAQGLGVAGIYLAPLACAWVTARLLRSQRMQGKLLADCPPVSWRRILDDRALLLRFAVALGLFLVGAKLQWHTLATAYRDSTVAVLRWVGFSACAPESLAKVLLEVNDRCYEIAPGCTGASFAVVLAPLVWGRRSGLARNLARLALLGGMTFLANLGRLVGTTVLDLNGWTWAWTEALPGYVIFGAPVMVAGMYRICETALISRQTLAPAQAGDDGQEDALAPSGRTADPLAGKTDAQRRNVRPQP